MEASEDEDDDEDEDDSGDEDNSDSNSDESEDDDDEEVLSFNLTDFAKTCVFYFEFHTFTMKQFLLTMRM